MFVPRLTLALLVSWHVVAVFLGALPPAARFTAASAKVSPETTPDDRSNVAAALDSSLRFVLPALRAVALVGDWARPVVRRYHQLTGTRQSWSMFGDPPRSDRYMRLRYYVRPVKTGRLWTATELVWPASPEDEVRLLSSFRDSFRDKALDNSLDRFRERRRPSLVQPGTQSTELPDDLAPVARYFARRFTNTHLPSDGSERIVRTEVWVGTARNHEPGDAMATMRHADRITALRAYYEGPVEQRFSLTPLPPYHAAELEADIEWLLDYFEE